MFTDALVIYKQLRQVKKFREDRELRVLHKQKQIVENLQDKIKQLQQNLHIFYHKRLRISDNLYDSMMHRMINQRNFAKVRAKIYHLHFKQQEMELQVLDYKNQLTKEEDIMTQKRQVYLQAHLETNKFDEIVKIEKETQALALKRQEEQFLNEFIDEMNVLNLG